MSVSSAFRLYAIKIVIFDLHGLLRERDFQFAFSRAKKANNAKGKIKGKNKFSSNGLHRFFRKPSGSFAFSDLSQQSPLHNSKGVTVKGPGSHT